MTYRVLRFGLIVGLLAAPLVAETQSAAKAARIGFLGNGDPKTSGPFVEAFRQGLRDLGWVEGPRLRVEVRWAEGRIERLPALVDELLRLEIDVLVLSGTPALQAAQRATRTVPIVAGVLLGDPVRAGFVPNLARPGGNITGVASQYEEIVTKQVQLLAEAVPTLSRMVLLRHTSASPAMANAATAAADALGLKARVLEVGEASEAEGAFKTARDDRAQAVLVLPSPVFGAHRRLLIGLAAKYRLPAFYEFREFVEDGGLMSYGPSLPDMWRRAASHVDRILKGARPGELPIERPAKFDLVVNLRTAKTLGLTIPPSVLARADEIIQ
jgi:putative ABC transport system substrate-binding protein